MNMWSQAVQAAILVFLEAQAGHPEESFDVKVSSQRNMDMDVEAKSLTLEVRAVRVDGERLLTKHHTYAWEHFQAVTWKENLQAKCLELVQAVRKQ